MKSALQLLASQPGRLAASAALAAAMVLAGIGLMATSGYLIGSAALHPDTVLALMVAVTGVRFFGLTRAVVRYAERLVSHDLTLRLLAALRRRVFARLLPLAPLGSGGHHSADLMGRLVGDVDELQTLYLRLVAPLLAAVLVAAACVSLLAAYCAPAAWATLALLLASGGLLPAGLAWAGRNLGRREATCVAERRMLLLDTLRGAHELWVYGRSDEYRGRLADLDRQMARLAAARARLEGLRDGAGALLGLAAPWLAVVAALPQVSEGKLSGLALLPIALGVSGAFEATAPLAEAFERWGRSTAAAGRIEQIVDRAPAIVDPPRPLPLPTRSELRMHGAAFTHGKEPILEDVDLMVAPGRRVAVVGASGAGKSTLLKGLVRFLDPSGGNVTLGGVDLRQLAQQELRDRLAVVPQHVTLFNSSVRANLAIARPGAADDELWRALAAAELEQRVAELPEGLDSMVGEYGSRLSMGERQRLALARALLKGAPLLILDEPTAHLDAITARRLLERLLAARADSGVVLATHRLVGLDRVDEIIVLDDGRIVQRGTHAALSTRTGPYRRMLEAAAPTLDQAAARLFFRTP